MATEETIREHCAKMTREELVKTIVEQNVLLNPTPQMLQLQYDQRVSSDVKMTFAPHPSVGLIMGSFKSMVDETKPPNYLCFRLSYPDFSDEYEFTLMRVGEGRKSPHDKREEAEAVLRKVLETYEETGDADARGWLRPAVLQYFGEGENSDD